MKQLQSTRRTAAVGNPMLVKLPKTGYTNTGEGGLSFFFGISQKEEYSDKRNITCEGTIYWAQPDVCLNKMWDKNHIADGLLLVGSTSLSLFDGQEYFQATHKDLTAAGKKLYTLLKQIYGEVDIITLLDT